jgi:multisubunit Na+/H+ antiporter MnhF subunit
MNEWEIAAVALGAALIPCIGVCMLSGIGDGLVALEVACVLVTSILMVLSEGLQRQPFIDLALVFALLSLLGSLAFARLLEHDL